jgi:hypothetical protein
VAGWESPAHLDAVARGKLRAPGCFSRASISASLRPSSSTENTPRSSRWLAMDVIQRS